MKKSTKGVIATGAAVMLLLGGGLWLAVACVATSLCAVAALGYGVIEALIGFASMVTALGLAYKLLYDYVRVKE